MDVQTAKRQLTQLNREIEQLEAELSRLESERRPIANEVAGAARRFQYLQLAKRLRGPGAKFEWWPTAVMIVGGAVVGITLLVLASLVSSSFLLALLALIIGLASGAGVCAMLLYRPPEAQLPAAIASAESQSRLAAARLSEKLQRIDETKARLQKLNDERRDQVATGKLQRAALLQRNWKAMRDAEWEDFVVEACRTLGATVERTGSAGETDANLVADFGARRVAIMTPSEPHVVDSSTIQKALATKDRFGCQSCAVIVNRRITGAAQDFARRNGCTTVGAIEFPDFVLGTIEI